MTDLKALKTDLLAAHDTFTAKLTADQAALLDSTGAWIAARMDAAIAADTPAPLPDPDPVPPGPPDPIPDPPPATPVPPAPVNLRDFIEKLRTRETQNGVMDPSKLKVVGQDALPKGATFSDTNVTLTGGVTFDGWDIGSRGLHIKGRASIANVFGSGIKGQKAGGPLYPIQIGQAGDLEWSEFVELHGTFGQSVGPSKVLAAQGSRPGQPWAHGKVRMMRRCRFEGFPQDHLFTYGVPGGEERIEENYFGPQWGVSGKEHADAQTMGGLAGLVYWRRNFIDHTWDGKPYGLNNVFRLVPNKIDAFNRDDLPFEAFLAEENLCLYPSLNQSVPVHIARGGQKNWGVNGNPPRFDFVRNWMMPGKGGLIFYQGSAAAVTTWDGNVNALTGAPLALA